MKSKNRQCGTFGSCQDGERDCHHLLFPRHDWSRGAAHLLRNETYYRLFIPKTSLHRHIHQAIPNIPVPSLDDCHDAWERLQFARKHHRVDILHDSPERRLDFLIHVWSKNYPAVADALEHELNLFATYAPEEPIERHAYLYLPAAPAIALA